MNPSRLQLTGIGRHTLRLMKLINWMDQNKTIHLTARHSQFPPRLQHQKFKKSCQDERLTQTVQRYPLQMHIWQMATPDLVHYLLK